MFEHRNSSEFGIQSDLTTNNNKTCICTGSYVHPGRWLLQYPFGTTSEMVTPIQQLLWVPHTVVFFVKNREKGIRIFNQLCFLWVNFSTENWKWIFPFKNFIKILWLSGFQTWWQTNKIVDFHCATLSLSIIISHVSRVKTFVVFY
jgi:hypothetical protein